MPGSPLAVPPGRLVAVAEGEGAGVEIVAAVLRFGGGFVPAFVLTWLIESIVYLWAFQLRGWLAVRTVSDGPPAPLTPGAALGLVLLVNLATHPLLWLFTATVPGAGPLLLAEAVAVAIEGTLVALAVRRRVPGGQRPWIWAYLAALLANAVSLLFGLVLFGPALRALGVAGSSACC